MEHLLKSASPGLQRAWTAIRSKIHCGIESRQIKDAGLGLVATEAIPKDFPVFEVQDTIPGYRMVHVEEFKEKIVSDILDYTSTLHPDKPGLLENLNISF